MRKFGQGNAAKSGKVAYFEPDSRLQSLEKLHHLALFSDFLIILSGERGAGKSMLVKELLKSVDSEPVVCCKASLMVETGESALLDMLASSLPDHDWGNDTASKLTGFNSQVTALRAHSEKVLIVIDDAQRLTDEALELILNLQFADENNDGLSPQVLLSGDSQLIARLDQLGWLESIGARLHHQILNPFTEAEFAEFLTRISPKAEGFAAKQLKKLYQSAEGYPGRVSLVDNDISVKSGPKSAKPKPTTKRVESTPKTKRALPFSPLVSVSLGAFLLAILGGSYWLYLPDSAPVVTVDDGADSPIVLNTATPSKAAEPSPALSEISRRLDEQERQRKAAQESSELTEQSQASAADESGSALTENSTVEAPAPIVEQPDHDAQAQTQTMEPATTVPRASGQSTEIVPNQSAETASIDKATAQQPNVPVTEVEQKTTAPVTVAVEVSETSPIPQKVVANPVQAENNQITKSPKVLEDEALILSWPSTGYALQLLGARSYDSVERFFDLHGREGFKVFSTNFKGRPFYVIVSDRYDTRTAAAEAVNQLPEAVQKLRPWARSIKGIHSDIRK
jgi:DamX protein